MRLHSTERDAARAAREALLSWRKICYIPP
jgi:hypothetical protein